MKPVAIELPGLSPFRLELHRHRPDLYICPHLHRHRIWEPDVTSYLLDTLEPGQTVIDVGAHIGYFTLMMSRLVGGAGKVFAFEPDPCNFALLQTNLRLNRVGNVLAERKAVSNRLGRAKLYIAKDNTGDHRLYGTSAERAVHEVDVVSLDGYSACADVPVHLVKIDAQGLESRILDGMSALIERNRARLSLVVEFAPALLRRAGSDTGDFLGCLQRLGATAFWFSEGSRGWRTIPVPARDLRGIAEVMLHMNDEGCSRDVVLRFDS